MPIYDHGCQNVNRYMESLSLCCENFPLRRLSVNHIGTKTQNIKVACPYALWRPLFINRLWSIIDFGGFPNLSLIWFRLKFSLNQRKINFSPPNFQTDTLPGDFCPGGNAGAPRPTSRSGCSRPLVRPRRRHCHPALPTPGSGGGCFGLPPCRPPARRCWWRGRPPAPGCARC